MFCGLEEELTRFRKKKKKKKKREERKKCKKPTKKILSAKSGLGGINRYLKTYKHVKYFRPT